MMIPVALRGKRCEVKFSAWWWQLVVGGRIVVPLRLHSSGLTRSIAFDLTRSDRMVSSSAQVCGFVPMRGATAHAERCLQLADDVVLYLDAADIAVKAALGQALSYSAHEYWTGVTIGDREPVEHLDLWLATTSSSPLRRPICCTGGTVNGPPSPSSPLPRQARPMTSFRPDPTSTDHTPA